MKEHAYCPACGSVLVQFQNNKPAADFYCAQCAEQYELKSKEGQLGIKITDGAYHSMVSRILSADNPGFFFLCYSKSTWSITDLVLIPKHFFTPGIIEKRNPLAASSKRAGWTGCNIRLSEIPQSGRISLVQSGCVVPKETVLKKWAATTFVKEIAPKSKNWLLDILRCLEQIQSTEFKLQEVYRFEPELSAKHPGNKHIKDKIRQQLQVLRDHGFIEFTARGTYRKITI